MMNSIFSIFLLSSLWISFSAFSNKFFNKILKNETHIKNILFLSLSLGFIFSFVLISDIDLLFHLFGINFSFNYFLLIIPFAILFINRKNIKIFLKKNKTFHNELKKLLKKSFLSNNLFIYSLFVIVVIQLICLTIRSFLPLTHGDAMGQYFYDSLQISRLANLNILEYYQMGGSLRSDSLAAFFDAFFIQLTNSWSIARFARYISLFLVILSSLEMVSNLGNLNLKKGLVLTCAILTLPDIWSSFLSGKHDGYIFLFEFSGIYIISLSILIKDKFSKLILLLLSIFIAFISVSSRLSSLTFLLISCLLFVYYFLKFRYFYFKKILKGFSISISTFQIIVLILATITSLIIFIINNYFLSNPFYWLSPPGFLYDLFPDAKYDISYALIKEDLSLNNTLLVLRPIATFLYTALSIEPIRYVLTKLQEQNELFLNLLRTINIFGPKDMMVSILSFTPFVLLPYLNFNFLKNNQKRILLLLTFWIILWSFSIPYSRTMISVALSLVVIAFSSTKNFNSFSLSSFSGVLKKSVFYYGIISIYLFTMWSISNMYDLPLKDLFVSKYSRTSLTREYIKLQNQTLGNKNLIPTLEFEKSWKKIEIDNPNKLLYLKAPSQFAYFMNRGLIVRKISNSPIMEKYQGLCFKVDNSQKILKDIC